MRRKHLGQAALHLALAALALYTLFPLYFLLVNSFKSQREIVASPVAPPNGWSLDYILSAAQKLSLIHI